MCIHRFTRNARSTTRAQNALRLLAAAALALPAAGCDFDPENILNDINQPQVDINATADDTGNTHVQVCVTTSLSPSCGRQQGGGDTASAQFASGAGTALDFKLEYQGMSGFEAGTYQGDLMGNDAQELRVSFNSFASKVTLAKPIVFTAPKEGATHSLATGDLQLTWTPLAESDVKMQWAHQGKCPNSADDWNETGGDLTDTGSFTIPNSIFAKLPAGGCQVSIIANRSRNGTMHEKLAEDGSILATQSRKVTLTVTP